MEKTTYNGWTNYETWVVNLWLDNDGYYNNCEHRSTDAYQLGQMIRDDLEQLQPEVTGLWADIINAAMREVNWKEIGASFKEAYIDDSEGA